MLYFHQLIANDASEAKHHEQHDGGNWISNTPSRNIHAAIGSLLSLYKIIF
jgi:hypothetical protein